jgi:glycosyltransferase involved in cell wall biosynthesis
VFLNVASIAPVKAQCDLVQAFVRAMASCPQAKLVLLGKPLDKEYHEQLLRLIDELDLRGSVIPAGHHDHVASFYRACDAFVLPSYYEGWSLAMNEAVCANLPIIASDVGGAADLLSEVGGKLIPPPYGSIVNLTFDGFKRCSHTYDSEFIGRLAEAMEATYRERPRPCVTAEIRERLGARHTYRIYEQLFTWFVQGASAESARPWLVAGRQD